MLFALCGCVKIPFADIFKPASEDRKGSPDDQAEAIEEPAEIEEEEPPASVADAFSAEAFGERMLESARDFERKTDFTFKKEDGLEEKINEALEGLKRKYAYGGCVGNVETRMNDNGEDVDVSVIVNYASVPPEIPENAEYTEEEFFRQVDEVMFRGERNHDFVFSADSLTRPLAVAAVLDYEQALKGLERAAAYYGYNAEYDIDDYDDYTVIKLDFGYYSGTVPYDELPVCASAADAARAVAKQWEEKPEAVFRCDKKPTDDAVIAIGWTAERNISAWPSMGNELSYMAIGESPVIVYIQRKTLVDKRELRQKRAELRQAVADAASKVVSAKTDEKYAQAYNAASENTEYDISIDIETDKLDKDMAVECSAYGALVGKKTINTGLARAYKDVCEAAGLECCVVFGTYLEASPHEWNAVRIDGKTYYVDPTFLRFGFGPEYFLFDDYLLEQYGYKISEDCVFPQWEAGSVRI